MTFSSSLTRGETQRAVRKFHRFPDYESARAKGNEMLEQLRSGDGHAITLTTTDALLYKRCLAFLRPTGVAIDTAASHFAKAFQILGGDLIIAAAQEYTKRHLNKVQPKLVPGAVDEFIVSQERRQQAGKLSAVHVDRQAARLRRFAGSVAKTVASVTGPDIDRFLDGLEKEKGVPVGPRTRDNWADEIVAFFEWAKVKRYAPNDFDEHHRITRLDSEEDGLIEIYTVEEMTDLLTFAEADLLPVLAIGAFAGLRTSEILRLDWSDVRPNNGHSHIIVQKGKVKKRTKSRRIVPMSENLIAWLRPGSCPWPSSGPV